MAYRKSLFLRKLWGLFGFGTALSLRTKGHHHCFVLIDTPWPRKNRSVSGNTFWVVMSCQYPSPGMGRAGLLCGRLWGKARDELHIIPTRWQWNPSDGAGGNASAFDCLSLRALKLDSGARFWDSCVCLGLEHATISIWRGNTVKAELHFGLHTWIRTCFCLVKGVFGFCVVEPPSSLGGRVVESAASRRLLAGWPAGNSLPGSRRALIRQASRAWPKACWS